ncbi:MAG: radical SAM family heme chaperone HemW [Deltaproteobacteria bacterium]
MSPAEVRLTDGRLARLGVYVHFPYCLSHCPYCDFAVEVAREIPEERYARAILGELARRAERFERLGPVRSVFFGGGTPSLWQPRFIGQILAAVDRRLGFTSDAEVSLEANPERATLERFEGFRSAGVGRLSLGVQSFDDRVLTALGRRHKGDEAARVVERALEAGFSSVSVDLIYGAAGQTVEVAASDARRVAALGVAHASAYALTLDELAVEVPMARSERLGRLRLPDGDLQAEMGAAVREALATGGLARYEVSNHAHEGHRSRHNLGYWLCEPYLGLGVGAVGSDGSERFTNGRPTGPYLEALERGELPPGEREVLGAPERQSERLFLGLRLVDGLDLRAFGADFGEREALRLRERAAQLAVGGLVTLGEERLALTERGLDLHGEICARLL